MPKYSVPLMKLTKTEINKLLGAKRQNDLMGVNGIRFFFIFVSSKCFIKSS